MSIYRSSVNKLSDLVEKPAGRKWRELKSWGDLTEPASSVYMGRHLAAVSISSLASIGFLQMALSIYERAIW